MFAENFIYHGNSLSWEYLCYYANNNYITNINFPVLYCSNMGCNLHILFYVILTGTLLPGCHFFLTFREEETKDYRDW